MTCQPFATPASLGIGSIAVLEEAKECKRKCLSHVLSRPLCSHNRSPSVFCEIETSYLYGNKVRTHRTPGGKCGCSYQPPQTCPARWPWCGTWSMGALGRMRAGQNGTGVFLRSYFMQAEFTTYEVISPLQQFLEEGNTMAL